MLQRPLVLLSVLLSVACASTTMTPRANTRTAIESYVEGAARLVASNGAAACDTFKQPAWFEGEWYIFMSEENGALVCHPARPDMVGMPQSDIVDPNGKRIGEEFMRAAASPAGSGWVEYVWARPGQTAPVAKSAYVRRVLGSDGKAYVVGSGGYEVQ